MKNYLHKYKNELNIIMKNRFLSTISIILLVSIICSLAFAEQYVYKPAPRKVRSSGRTTIDIAPGFFFPTGEFGEMAEPGFGGMINLNRQFSSKGFEAGLGTGLFHLSGKDLTDEGRAEYNSFDIVPMLVNTGFRIRLGSRFSIIPAVSFGMSFISIDYMYNGEDDDEDDYDKNEKTFDPTAMGGLGMRFSLNHLLSLSLTGKYGVFMEEDGNMPFATGAFLVEFRL